MIRRPRHIQRYKVAGNEKRPITPKRDRDYNYQRVIGPLSIPRVLELAHDGHMGKNRMEDDLRMYYWKGKTKDIKRWIRMCTHCDIHASCSDNPPLKAGVPRSRSEPSLTPDRDRTEVFKGQTETGRNRRVGLGLFISFSILTVNKK
jgi:hypothetical protein